MLEPQPATWYIVVICANCQSTVFLFRDLTNGQGSLKATYFVTCPHCRHKAEYDGRHYQHLEDC
jgi:DNA-directed RNA polymerase subunit RPC12/RpoP